MGYYLGIDLGGTNIKAGVVDDEFRIVGRAKAKTGMPRPAEEVMDAMDEALCVSSLRLSFLVYCENASIMTLPSTMKLASTMTMVTRRYFPNRDFCKGNPSFRRLILSLQTYSRRPRRF